jgi:hypothetical protein
VLVLLSDTRAIRLIIELWQSKELKNSCWCCSLSDTRAIRLIIELWQSKELKNSCWCCSLSDTRAIRLIIYGCGDRIVIIVMHPVDTHGMICDVT